MSNSRPHILLVDDDCELVSLMRDFLSDREFEVSVAYNGPDGLAAALGGGHDLLLLDVMMPGFDGFELLRRLRGETNLPVLMLTARTDSQSRILGLDGGADDYLPKPFEPMELVARIRAILRRTSVTRCSAKLEISGVSIDSGARRVQFCGVPVEVTSVEYEILETLVRGAGRVVTRDEIMQRLYQRGVTPFERSIDVHISHLRKKLGGPVDLIRTVRGVGYQFTVEETAVSGKRHVP